MMPYWPRDGGVSRPSFGGFACKGVMIKNQIAQLVFQDMGVNLGCGQICMAKKRLDHPQVRTTSQQMGRKCMAQGVRGDPRRVKPGLQRPALDQMVKLLA
jgi:hypothetical protein